MDYEIAQLRHMYYMMTNDMCKDPNKLAKGILGPAIEKLENVERKSKR